MKPRSIVSTRALVWLSASAIIACAGVPYVYATPHAAAGETLAGEALAAMQDSGGFGPVDPTPPSGITVQEIVAKMAARESAFNQARESYTFRQSVKVATISEETNKVDGEYQQITDITFNPAGKREEHVVFAPQNTLERILMTPADFEEIEHRLPFVLTAGDLPMYDVSYLGKQKVDELETYVFQAGPKTMEKGKRYFQGKVWVDQQDLQIVLVNGMTVPQDKRKGHEDLSPPFTTYYEQVDGKFWFPTYTKAEGTLHFPAQQGAMSQDIHVRNTVKYTDYKQFRAKSRIIFNGEDITNNPDTQPKTPPKK